MNNVLNIAGRLLFVIPFLAFGIRHLMHASLMGGMVPIPGGVIWVYVTGAAMILASIAALTGIQGRLAMMLLALLLIIYAFSIHLPGMMGSDPMMNMGSTVSFYKDLGLAGGALILASYFGLKEKHS